MYPNHLHLNKYFTASIIFFLFCYACSEKRKKDLHEERFTGAFSPNYPYGFDPINFPKDNELNASRIELGKKIFFDPQFSADQKISCGSCHKPEFAFADTVKTHKGSHDSTNNRNSPSLINIGYHPYFDYDGGVPTLELQVLVPFDGEDEMHGNLLTASKLMKKDKKYLSLAKQAYDREPDPYVITRALAAYQRSLISTGSKYDLYKKTKGKKGLSPEEEKGMNLFFSQKANCSKCHTGILFTNFAFENIGLPNNSNDSGRKRVTLEPLDAGKFKTPGLRNIARTFPYMHDGSLKTLENVIEFYNKGGITKTNKSEWVKPLNLSTDEKKALVSFLKSLNDTILTK
jgi:cytochrome c peroxidase